VKEGVSSLGVASETTRNLLLLKEKGRGTFSSETPYLAWRFDLITVSVEPSSIVISSVRLARLAILLEVLLLCGVRVGGFEVLKFEF